MLQPDANLKAANLRSPCPVLNLAWPQDTMSMSAQLSSAAQQTRSDCLLAMASAQGLGICQGIDVWAQSRKTVMVDFHCVQQVKLEQDLALRAAEDRAARQGFRAKALPISSIEPR